MTGKALIYILDDEKNITKILSEILTDEGYEVKAFADYEPMKIEIEVHKRIPDLLLLDIWLKGKEDGIAILKELKLKYPLLKVIMISGHGNIGLAVQSTKLGAYDFLEKPLSTERVLTTIENALKLGKLERENIELKKVNLKYDEIIGQSEAILKVKEVISQIAGTNARVFIRGENGTGKELVARSIHFNSHRANKPFVEVNCAAIPEELIESELFGYEKGAFTGAQATRIGKFEQANGGTLFLDEICDMSLNTQAKVLRVLQENKLQRLGSNQTIPLDIRIITATNVDVQKAIAEGRFREDLYYRINVIPIYLPPLRERKEDIPLLIHHYLKVLAKENLIKPKWITEEAMEFLVQYDWPGNVRELRNIVERILILSPEETITLQDIHNVFSVQPYPITMNRQKRFLDLKAARENFERDYIYGVLKECDFHVSKAAEVLGIERTHLYRKIKNLGIPFDRSKHQT